MHSFLKQYKKIKQIGKGPYSKVYLVEQIHTKKKFAMKKIETQQGIHLNELKLLQKLKHPNVIQVKDFHVDKKNLNVIQQGDLHEYLKNHKLDMNQKIQILKQICKGMQYIHDMNILHRDIKMKNIFVFSNNKVKIGDFGISKNFNTEDQYAQTAIGTPFYLSPEICSGKQYNYKSDIWSLGCLFYELITTKRPFDGNFINVIQKGNHSQNHKQ